MWEIYNSISVLIWSPFLQNANFIYSLHELGSRFARTSFATLEMNNLDVMFWKPLEKFKEVNWFRWRVPFRMIRIPTVNNSSIKRDRERSASFHITIVTKKHQNFFYLKKIFLISIHRLRSKKRRKLIVVLHNYANKLKQGMREEP